MELPSNTIRLLIADDQPTILRGLALMLDSEDDVEVVGQAKDGLEVIELASKLRPDVIIMDLQMPRLTGVEATRAISLANTKVKIVALTTFDSDHMVEDALSAGAHAYLFKDEEEKKLLATIRAVHRDEHPHSITPDSPPSADR